MKLRTILIVTLSLLMIGFPVFAGGGGQRAAEQMEIRCGAGSVGGIFFVQAAAVSTIVNKYVPEVNFSPVTTAAGTESYNRLARGGLETYVANSDLAWVGYNGGDPDRPNVTPSRSVRTWFITEASPFMLVARADNPNMTRFEDIWRPGLRVGTAPIGSGAHNMLTRMSEFLGNDFAQLNIHTAGHEQSMNALRDRNVDMVFNGSGTLSVPNSAYQDLANSVRMVIIDMPENLRDLVVREPFWGKFTLEPGWLTGHDRPTNVVAIRNGFFVHEDVPEEIVYTMTAAVFDNLDELKEIAYMAFRTMGPRTAALDAVVPFHPGALRYFREKGFDVSLLQ